MACCPAGLSQPTPNLSPQDAQQLVIQHLAAVYDRTAGYRLLQFLQQRCLDVPVPQEASALGLGNYFPLMTYRAPVRDLSMLLLEMETAKRIHCHMPDVYRRESHILRCVATPGLGKSTAAEALWPALHQAWQSQDILSAVGVAAGAVDGSAQADILKLRRRVLNSLTPGRLLVFKLSFNTGKAVSVLSCCLWLPAWDHLGTQPSLSCCTA